MERRLLEAARKGNIHELHELISSNELILEEMDLEESGHTPLHVACVAGHLDFVQELLKRMPKLAEKVNEGGFSPLHVAAARGNVEIARELLIVGPHLCSVKGRERRVPLHYAAIKGELDVMKLLLSASPESIEETTAREETALHLAVKNNRFDAVVALVEHLKQHKKEQVINWKDNKGNTILHLAAAGKNFEVVDFLLRGHAVEREVVDVNAPNDSGLTPLDVSTLSQRGARDREIRDILARAGAKHGGGRSNTGDDDDIAAGNGYQSDGEPVTSAPDTSAPLFLSRTGDMMYESVLVVAALIANATYQSVLQPPSIVGNDSASGVSVSITSSVSGNNTYSVSTNKENTLTYGASLVYILFMGGNTFGFLLSVQTIIHLAQWLLFFKKPILLSLIAMVLTYFCFTLSLLISLGGTATVTVLPLTIAVFLLLMQKWLVIVVEFFLRQYYKLKIFGNLYSIQISRDL